MAERRSYAESSEGDTTLVAGPGEASHLPKAVEKEMEGPKEKTHHFFNDPSTDTEIVSNDGVLFRHSSFMLAKCR